jgi:hypothetical protein
MFTDNFTDFSTCYVFVYHGDQGAGMTNSQRNNSQTVQPQNLNANRWKNSKFRVLLDWPNATFGRKPQLADATIGRMEQLAEKYYHNQKRI